MKNLLPFLFLFFLLSCGKEDTSPDSDGTGVLLNEDSSSFTSEKSESTSTPSASPQGSGSGLITAGEWNDLEEWAFWKDLLSGDYSDKSDYWHFYLQKRVSVLVKKDTGFPASNVKVVLQELGNTIWEARTDNKGKAELWIDLFREPRFLEISNYSLLIDDAVLISDIKLYEEGTNEVQVAFEPLRQEQADLAFIVDATGSMGDELAFLQDDLENVIKRVEDKNQLLHIRTSSVFYRDEGDDYVVKHSPFTSDISKTINFIRDQSAGGGGDFPEAVQEGLQVAIQQLSWSEKAKCRIAFLLLDAPPHYNLQVIENLQNLIRESAREGIKIIPVTASGINKETEFLMRFFSITTNGTYVFITDDSGIGNAHLKASIGEYEVEFLNDLMVRLIEEFTE